jgi:hypothetical protein
LPDPLRLGKVTYPLGEVLLLCLLAVLGGAETFVDIARFGKKKIGLFRRLRPFAMERLHTIPPKLSRQSPAAALHSAPQVAAPA